MNAGEHLPKNIILIGFMGCGKSTIGRKLEHLLGYPLVDTDDLIAEGVIGAVAEIGVEVPVVVRLEGNNAELGRQVLADSGLNIIAATSLTDAAQQAVKAAGGAA